MKRLTSFLAALCCALLIQALPAAAQTVSIRADVWYPMNGNPRDDNKLGYMIDLAKAIFAKHSVDVDYQTMPWERAVKSVRSGEFDCVVGAYKDDAPDFVFPTDAWGMDVQNVYVKAGNTWKFNGVDSLAGHTLGLIGGYAYDDKLSAYLKQHPQAVQYVKANNALEQNIHKVIGGRIDGTVESVSVMSAKLKEMGLAGQLQPAGQLGKPTPMYIACSPAKATSKQYISWIDQGTDEMRKDGSLQKILSKYGLSDWQ